MTADTLTDTLASPSHAPTYPAHWRMVRLGDVGELVRGVSYDKDDARDTSEVGYMPILRASNIQDRELILTHDLVFVKAARIGNIQRVRLGDVVIAMSSGSKTIVGKAAQLDKEWTGAIGAFCGIFRPDVATIDTDFVGHVFQSANYRKHIETVARGTNINNLTREHILGHTIPLPPLAEQRAIARVLRAAQDAIAARRREVTLERERKAALMQRLFTHGVRGEPTQQTEIGEMPQSWQMVRLGDVLAQTQYGLSLRGESSGDYPILRMNNLVEGHVDITDLQYVTTGDAIARQFQLAHGDILFNRTNSYELVGKTALFDLPGRFLFASYLIRIVPLAGKLLSGFLNAYLNSAQTQQRFRMLASRGVSQSNISASKLAGFLIPLPSVDEQRAIGEVFAAFDIHIAALEREIALHEELFRALLEELMSGRLSAMALAEEETRVVAE